ncbi:hypothetical protein [Acetivibrio straminisolvens]|jgi:hypothetical protein|uniref:Uncharacterized protein n=1 Tax=Acetivibrio straminisolvens JCM 21531 TaxID=1294263 RepID=W4V7D8_9FIRM|nr:hypothetical protein [Acetivibrio straminisolvens]GAE89127.1 hypothetical protein JCM21531_2622 [Acetivibrio straminisolvens JCM 21531]
MSNTSNKHINLESGRLSVQIAHPGSVYNGSRFDWTAFITKIVLDNKYSFCVPESEIPGQGSGGFGLCNEFGINTPIGYDEAKPQEKFPKLGTGLLTRPDESDYFFFDKYEVEPFPVKISMDANAVVFDVEPVDCNGYAVKMTKAVTLKDNILTVDYCLKNVGSKSIKTEEYCHNFFSVNNNRIGDGFVLKFPYDIKPIEIPEVMNIKGNEIRWNFVPKGDFYCQIEGFESVRQHYWELVYEPERVGIREYSEFEISKVAVWGTTHVVSPEIFINVDIAPGKTQEWTRRYEFFTF